MPCMITAYTSKGMQMIFGEFKVKDFEAIHRLVNVLRENDPSIVRVVIDVALPYEGNIP
jgi:hypothetical protein